MPTLRHFGRGWTASPPLAWTTVIVGPVVPAGPNLGRYNRPYDFTQVPKPLNFVNDCLHALRRSRRFCQKFSGRVSN